MSWLLIDVEDLLGRRRAQHETTSASVGAGAAGATTSVNVGAYPKPFGGVLRRTVPDRIAMTYAARRRRRKS